MRNTVLDFEYPGMTWKDDIVLRDRQTQSLWCHHEGRAIAGPLRGTVLERIPLVQTRFEEWRRLHPDTRVLAKYKESYEPNWDHDPNGDYARNPRLLGTRGSRSTDLRLPGKAMIAGLERGADAVALPFSRLAAAPIVNESLNRLPVVVAFLNSAQTALAWSRRVAGQELHMKPAPAPPMELRMRDEETGTLWDALRGRALSGPLRGRVLLAVPVISGYWWVWARHYPATRIAP